MAGDVKMVNLTIEGRAVSVPAGRFPAMSNLLNVG